MDNVFYDERSHIGSRQPPSSSSGSSAPNASARPPSTAPDNKQTRRRTKTGCLTCRKRRIKCDEAKPECHRCLKSKRTCEGYNVKTVFRHESIYNYQQNLRPSTAPDMSFVPAGNPIQFSMAQYVSQDGGHARDRSKYFTSAQYDPTAINFVPMSHLPQTSKNAISASRNSSASNGSGISADSQGRISVLSLMSSEKNGGLSREGDPATIQLKGQFQEPVRTPETDIRDNFYYSYYVSYHAYTLARTSYTDESTKGSATDDPFLLWPQTVPSLINEDPPGRRPLFDAVIAYTAHVRFEEILVDFQPHSNDHLARTIELGLKSYIDIFRGTTETLNLVQAFYTADDQLNLIFRWGILQHTITSILADANPRVPWVNFLGNQAFGLKMYTPTSEIEGFYLAALRHISSNSTHIPQSILNLQNRYDFLSVPGMDIIYFAFIQDYNALRNIAYHVLTNPRLEYLSLIYRMISGGRLRGEPDLDPLADELMVAVRHSA